MTPAKTEKGPAIKNIIQEFENFKNGVGEQTEPGDWVSIGAYLIIKYKNGRGL
jgi:hypothetical protein